MRSVDPCVAFVVPDVEDELQSATYHVNHDAVMGRCRNLVNMSTVDLGCSVEDKRKWKGELHHLIYLFVSAKNRFDTHGNLNHY